MEVLNNPINHSTAPWRAQKTGRSLLVQVKDAQNRVIARMPANDPLSWNNALCMAAAPALMRDVKDMIYLLVYMYASQLTQDYLRQVIYRILCDKKRYLIYEHDLPDTISTDHYKKWFHKSLVIEGVRMGLPLYILDYCKQSK